MQGLAFSDCENIYIDFGRLSLHDQVREHSLLKDKPLNKCSVLVHGP